MFDTEAFSILTAVVAARKALAVWWSGAEGRALGMRVGVSGI
jgi:hypothetical protein